MTENPVAQEFRFTLRFWGVRGSTPTTGPDFAGFGGNTACLELQLSSGETLIFDGGTGLRHLGHSLAKRSAEAPSLRLFLTHFHWDHIQGIPFFSPLFRPGNRMIFYSGGEPERLRGHLAGQMTTPYFPVDFHALPAQIDFAQAPADGVETAGALVRAFPMNHPQGASGYRVEHNGAVVVYASDLEHGHPQLDQVVREYAHEADILIYDAQFTPQEYQARAGWGHSTWLEATRVARDAGVKKLLLIHHDPEHNDSQLREIVDLARGEFEHTDAAREGMTIQL